MGYSFYDISYRDDDGDVKEIRIFHKGKIELDNKKYSLTFSKRNLNFLKDIDEKID